MSKYIEKLWGSERWIENSEKYCMKLLILQPEFQSSMHYHKVKTETFLVVRGKVMLEIMPFFQDNVDAGLIVKKVYLRPFQSYTLTPYTPHRFTAIDSEAIVVEASTQHDDEDVYRLEESKKIA